MTEIPSKETVRTEVHEVGEKVDQLSSKDPSVQGKIAALKTKIATLKTHVEKVIQEAFDQKITAEAIQKQINDQYTFEQYQKELDELVQKKDTLTQALVDTYAKNVEVNFKKTLRVKSDTPSSTHQETPTATVEDKKQQELTRRKNHLANLKDASALKTVVEKTDMLDAVLDNTLLSKIHKKAFDLLVSTPEKQTQLQQYFDALTKTQQTSSQDSPKRLDYMRMLHSLMKGIQGFYTQEELLAGENLWRVRMNTDTGPDRKRVLPTKDEQWKMLTSEELAKDPAPLSATPPTQEQTPTDTTAKPEPVPAPNPKEAAPLEWSEANKEAIVTEVTKEALSALQKASTVDLAGGKSLEFTANGKKCALSKEGLQYGDKVTHFSMSASNMTLPLKSIAYESESLALTVVAPIVGDKKGVLTQEQLKNFLRFALDKTQGGGVAQMPPFLIDGHNIQVSFS